jgi:hypothetical protein
MITNSFDFTPASVSSLTLKGTKQDTYFDSHKKSIIPNCKLSLVVGAKSKTYYLVFRKNVNGKPTKRSIKLGSHPIFSVAMAREKYLLEAINIVTDENKFLSMKKNDGVTINDMINFYDEEKGIPNYENFLFNEVRNNLGNVQAKNLTRYTVQDFYKPQIQNGNLHSANSRREVIQRIWNYNIADNKQCEFLEDRKNPASWKIKGFVKEASTRLIEKYQIRPLMDSIELEQHEDKKDLLKLFFYLGQHPYTEICLMRWDQIQNDPEYPDTKWWVMEEGFHKVKKLRHSVYLHPDVLDIINKQKGKDDTFVFTSRDNLDENGNRQPYGKTGFVKQMKRIKDLLDTQDIDIRCFRASLTTHLREMNQGYEPSYLLGQALTGISNRVYTRSEFKPHKMSMTNAWMDFIEGCE